MRRRITERQNNLPLTKRFLDAVTRHRQIYGALWEAGRFVV